MGRPAQPSRISSIAGFEMAMFWHDRHDSDPVHAFVRIEVAHVAAAVPAPAGKARHRK
jgi:hypothetical protein